MADDSLNFFLTHIITSKFNITITVVLSSFIKDSFLVQSMHTGWVELEITTLDFSTKTAISAVKLFEIPTNSGLICIDFTYVHNKYLVIMV